jgi:hypothetical protein
VDLPLALRRESGNPSTEHHFEPEQFSSSDMDLPLAALRESWNPSTKRQFMPDPDWTLNLASYINGLIDLRVNHVRLWLDSNLERFQAGHATIEDIRRQFDDTVIEIRTNVQLCRAICKSCRLLCVLRRFHEGDHSCQTSHDCVHSCRFCNDDERKCCGTP